MTKGEAYTQILNHRIYYANVMWDDWIFSKLVPMTVSPAEHTEVLSHGRAAVNATESLPNSSPNMELRWMLLITVVAILEWPVASQNVMEMQGYRLPREA